MSSASPRVAGVRGLPQSEQEHQNVQRCDAHYGSDEGLGFGFVPCCVGAAQGPAVPSSAAVPSELPSSSLRAPAARVLISPSAEVREGDDVSLMCQVAGEPQDDTVYSWYKDSKRLQESPDHLLALPRVASAAAGSYHCRARSPSGTSISPAVALHVCCKRDTPGNQGGREWGAGGGMVLEIGWCQGWCWDGMVPEVGWCQGWCRDGMVPGVGHRARPLGRAGLRLARSRHLARALAAGTVPKLCMSHAQEEAGFELELRTLCNGTPSALRKCQSVKSGKFMGAYLLDKPLV